MAVCYSCRKQFYGNKCPHCGWKATYSCHKCGVKIDASTARKCQNCGWFYCRPGHCGCDFFRPLSNEEKRRKIFW